MKWFGGQVAGAPVDAVSGLSPGFETVPYPRTPLEQLYAEQNQSRWYKSRHTKDLRTVVKWIAFVVLLSLAFALVKGIESSEAQQIMDLRAWYVEGFRQTASAYWPLVLGLVATGIATLLVHFGSKLRFGRLLPRVALICAVALLLLPVMTGLPNVDGFDVSVELLRVVVRQLEAYFVAGAVTAVGGAIVTLYQFGKERFSTVDIFSSEIAARIRTLAADNSVMRIIGGVSPGQPGRANSASADVAPDPESIEPSEESQFNNFHQRSADLGALGSSVVDHVTAFYNYHMAARDELRNLSKMTKGAAPEGELKGQLANVIFMVDLMAMSAIQALDDLIETDVHKAYCRQLALCVGTTANRYLITNIGPGDHRYYELRVRNEAYVELTKELKADLNLLKPKLRERLGQNSRRILLDRDFL